MNNLKTREVIKNIASDNKVSSESATAVIKTVFEYIRYQMSEVADRDLTYFPNIRIPNFALFYVKDALKERYKIINKKNKEEENESDRV